MKNLFPSILRQLLFASFAVAFTTRCFSAQIDSAKQKQPPVNEAGLPVLDSTGHHLNYSQPQLAAAKSAAKSKMDRTTIGVRSRLQAALAGFVPTPPDNQKPFWQYAIFGSGIGLSNIIIGPTPAGGGVPEIIIGGSSGGGFGADDFWQSIRYNSASGNYDQIFVSPVYSAAVQQIAIADVVGDSKPEIVVMLGNGQIYLYDFATKTELGYVNTGINGLLGLCVADLNGDGHAELIVTTSSDLFVFDNTGNLLWQVAGAGGSDVVAGQMDNDPAMEIATTSGNVVDASTHAIQWTRNGGFGAHLKLAPLAGAPYQQLVVAEAWNYVYGYDVAQQLPLWSIKTPQDIGAIQIADVDGDHVPDIIIGDGQWGTIHVHDLNTQAQKWAASNPNHGVTSIAIGDVDGDGTVDLLWGSGWTSSGADNLYVANTTGTHNIKWQSIDLEGPFLGPAIGDLDGDGQLELVVCSLFSNAAYDSGRILVFDAATLALRGISAPVVSDRAWTGVRDLKLRDVDGDGRMKIIIGADYLYDGAIEIYRFDSNNTFTRTWTNSTRPSGSPFNFVDVADLDGNGTKKVIGGNTVADTGSDGVYIYVYDYPSGANSWRSVNLASGFSSVTGMVVQDLDGNGSKEIAALVGTGDLYTFDGPSRLLRNLRQSTGFTLLSNQASLSGLVAGDSSGVAHFLPYAGNHYTESFTRQLGSTAFNGVSVLADGSLWAANNGMLSVVLPPSYNSVMWQSPAMGSNFGRFVATDFQNGEARVFASARQGVAGFILPDLTLVGASSRQTHGAAGTFDIPLPLTGPIGIECRNTGGNYTLVFSFSNIVASGSATITSGTGTVSGTTTFSGNTMTVNLSGVTNAQRLTVTLSHITDSFSRVLPDTNVVMGVLVADTNGDGFVNSADIGQTKAQSGQPITHSNFREDPNMDGLVNSADIGLVKSRSGTALP